MATCDASQILANAIAAGYDRLSKRDLVAVCVSSLPASTLEASVASLKDSELSEYDTAECTVQALCSSPGSSNTADQILAAAQANKIDQLSRRDLDAVQVSLLCTKTNPPCSTPTAPINPTAKVITNTTILIIWNQLSNTGSLITSYTVKWGTVSGVYPNSATTAGPIPKSYTITGLSSGTQYFWVVVANSFAGCSSANSNEGNATTSGSAPGPCADGIAYVTGSYQTNVTANAATTPAVGVQTALENLYCGLETDGILNSILWMNLMVPTAVGSVTDNAGGRALAKTAFIFVKGTTGTGGGNAPPLTAGYYDIQGVTGNLPASDVYAIGLNLSTDIASAQSCGWFLWETNDSMTGIAIGAGSSPGNRLEGTGHFTDGKTYSIIGDGTNNAITVASHVAPGFYSGQRVSNVDHRLFFANESTAFGQIGATDAVAFNGVLPNTTMSGWAVKINGANAAFCADTIHAMGVTTGMTSVQLNNLYNRLRTFMLAVGVSLTNGFLNSLVSYWRIDGAITNGLTTDYQDSNTLTTGGGVLNGSGGPFPATGYYGSGGQETINPPPANLKLGLGASFTFSMWVKGSNANFTSGTLAGQNTGVQATSAWVLFCAGGTTAELTGYSTDATNHTIVSANLVNDNATWNHVVCGYDAANKILFLQVNGAGRVTVGTTADLNSVATLFGMSHDSAGNAFGGAIAQAAFWNTALTSAQVIALYNSGKGVPFGAYTT